MHGGSTAGPHSEPNVVDQYPRWRRGGGMLGACRMCQIGAVFEAERFHSATDRPLLLESLVICKAQAARACRCL